ncbi:pseudouridine synthase [Pseudoalteromonas tunicata]|uniref:pseudouridine synthase n=1 Tax=Pseudoalteromonas tunicata TaxID=314281 RepID=UPI00273E1CAE|nr:pseudouridine synthase [Pseudoalteromonas tunicata]MDP5213594.1 pseudouridine synthase [Pseudoalteromonas tunicata]
MNDGIRLAKYIANAGLCSRRQASRLIDQGLVTVNGGIADHICFVGTDDVITVNDELLVYQTDQVYYLFNKPVGIDSRLLPNDSASLIHLLPSEIRIYPIGRLDKDSYGLMILTNDGELYHQMNHPDHHQEKEYRVSVERPIDANFCNKMAQGIPVDGQLTQPCSVWQTAENEFHIVLTQGLNRQIRKMAKHCGYKVVDLERIRIANLAIGDLSAGEFKTLTKADILLQR